MCTCIVDEKDIVWVIEWMMAQQERESGKERVVKREEKEKEKREKGFEGKERLFCFFV